MKLIIDIPNDLYNKYKNDNNIDDIHKWNILSFIRKGTPLDKIRAEIANHCGVNTDYCDSCRFCTDSIGVREILQIIDKYKAERE